jgi:hypothetical protein
MRTINIIGLVILDIDHAQGLGGIVNTSNLGPLLVGGYEFRIRRRGVVVGLLLRDFRFSGTSTAALVHQRHHQFFEMRDLTLDISLGEIDGLVIRG